MVGLVDLGWGHGGLVALSWVRVGWLGWADFGWDGSVGWVGWVELAGGVTSGWVHWVELGQDSWVGLS